MDFNDLIQSVSDDSRLVNFFNLCKNNNFYDEYLFVRIYQAYYEKMKAFRIKQQNYSNYDNSYLNEINSELKDMAYRQFKYLVNKNKITKNYC